jgi:hypothetical protein
LFCGRKSAWTKDRLLAPIDHGISLLHDGANGIGFAPVQPTRICDGYGSATFTPWERSDRRSGRAVARQASQHFGMMEKGRVVASGAMSELSDEMVHRHRAI